MLTPVSNRQSQISNVPPNTGCLTPETSAPPRFVVTLDEAPAEGLVRVPLAITGKWVRGTTTFAITHRDLEEIVRNFRERQSAEINVDYDHASEMPEVAAGGPVPSAGRIVRLDAPEDLRASNFGIRGPRPESQIPNPEPRFILWGWYEPTERARQLVKSREYRYLSPAIDWTARSKLTGKPQGTTLTSVALTNRPFLEELPQIRLSDPAFQPADESETGNSQSENRPPRREFRVSNSNFRFFNAGGPMKQVTLSVAEGKIKLAHDDFEDEYFVDPEDLKKCLEELGLLSEAALSTLQNLAGRPGAALSECLAEIGQRLAASQEISLAQASALLSEAEARGKSIPAAEFFRARVEQELDEAVKSGRVLPRQRAEWRKVALADFPTFRKVLAAQKPQVPLHPVGFAGSGPADVQAQVKFLAEQRMRERGLSFGQALSEIGREQPDLVQQYRRAVSQQ